MDILISALAFFLLLSVLILIHECGHFFAARKSKVTVEEFGFGLPPKAKTLFAWKGTNFTLNWIPFGGFVRLKGENAIDPAERSAPGSFAAASIPSRIFILVAGVFMNFVLAIVLLTAGFSVGQWIPSYVSRADMHAASQQGTITFRTAILVEDVLPESSAAEVGVPTNMLLVSIDGQPVNDTDQVPVLQQGKESVTYVLHDPEDATKQQTITVPLQDGQAGILMQLLVLELTAPTRGVGAAFMLSLRETGVMTIQTVKGFGQLFSSLASTGQVPEGITGIVGIAQLTHASVQEGFMKYLWLVAVLSLSLAVLNILPFPALDGGRLLFVLIEWITRRPLNRRFEVVTNAVGFSVLLLLIVIITFHDILRLF